MFQRGTKAEWEDSKLILLDGELAIESDTTKIKVGDGKSKYIDLPYIDIGNISFSELTEAQRKSIVGPKGEKGDPLTFDDLNPEQKKELKGEPGRDGKDGHTLTIQAYFSGTFRNHYTKGVRAHCDVFYDGTKIRVEDTDAEYTYFIDGENTKPIKDIPSSNDAFADTPRSNCEFIEIVYTVSYKGLKARSVARLVNVNDGANGSPGKGIVNVKSDQEVKIWVGSEEEYEKIEKKIFQLYTLWWDNVWRFR